MNPINAINQEFTRIVVEEWSDEVTIRQQGQHADTAPVGIIPSIRALIIWVRGQMNRHKDSRAITPLSETARRSVHG